MDCPVIRNRIIVSTKFYRHFELRGLFGYCFNAVKIVGALRRFSFAKGYHMGISAERLSHIISVITVVPRVFGHYITNNPSVKQQNGIHSIVLCVILISNQDIDNREKI